MKIKLKDFREKSISYLNEKLAQYPSAKINHLDMPDGYTMPKFMKGI